jgi:uncharacterized membrane protein YadS
MGKRKKSDVQANYSGPAHMHQQPPFLLSPTSTAIQGAAAAAAAAAAVKCSVESVAATVVLGILFGDGEG